MPAVEDHNQGRDIAIIGMSGRFPGARNVEELWSNLAGGSGCDPWRRERKIGLARVSAPRFWGIRITWARGITWTMSSSLTPGSSGSAPPRRGLRTRSTASSWSAYGRRWSRQGIWGERRSCASGFTRGRVLSQYLIHNLHSSMETATRRPTQYLQWLIGNDKDYLSHACLLQAEPARAEPGRADGVLDLAGRGVAGCQQLNNYECDLALAGGVTVEIPCAQVPRLHLRAGQHSVARRPLPSVRRLCGGHDFRQRGGGGVAQAAGGGDF